MAFMSVLVTARFFFFYIKIFIVIFLAYRCFLKLTVASDDSGDIGGKENEIYAIFVASPYLAAWYLTLA